MFGCTGRKEGRPIGQVRPRACGQPVESPGVGLQVFELRWVGGSSCSGRGPMVTRLMDLHCVIPCFFEQLLRKALLDEGNVTVRPLVPAEAQKSEGDFGTESPLLSKLPKCS